MPHILIFGLGYSAGRLADRLRADGWSVTATRRTADANSIGFSDTEAVESAIASASHILSSVPPAVGSEPVLDAYGDVLKRAPAQWFGYLSSTGVYGDTGGAWVDESAPIGSGRRKARTEADLAWQALRGDVHVFRLPGIYGPDRSVLDRIRQGKARRIDLPDQIFSRVHVDDIVGGVVCGFDGPAGVYNLSDDQPAPQNDVVTYGCALLGVEPPPLQTMDEAGLSEMARGFYSENRRVANGKAKRLLSWTPSSSDFRTGLRARALD